MRRPFEMQFQSNLITLLFGCRAGVIGAREHNGTSSHRIKLHKKYCSNQATVDESIRQNTVRVSEHHSVFV